MPQTRTIVHIYPEAAPKPLPGAPCNGCGVCCLLEPCPLGVLLSGKWTGACLGLRWHADLRQYRCGAISQPQAVLNDRLPNCLQFLSSAVGWVLRRFAHRWVAAGMECDCHVEVTRTDLS